MGVIFIGYCKIKFEEIWLTIYVNKEQHLPYWKLIIKKGNVMIVPQTGSISPPIHHQRGIYFYNMNYYAILKSTFTSTP